MPDFTKLSIELILLGAFAFIFLLQLIIYFGTFARLSFYKKIPAPKVNQPPVSIIMCARNEGDNLTEFLPKILTQDYPEFEVIVVNDCSLDNTEDVLREYSKIFTNLKTINIKEDGYYKTGKKFAMLVGIKGAKYEHLLMTDGDCCPESEHWISSMMQGYINGKEIVLGYGAYRKAPGFLNKLIRFDTFMIALQYLSLALKNKAYMGVGRNLSYKKELFFKHKGFSTHYHIKSGDDDLFVNQAATKSNVNVVLDQESFTTSIPETTMNNWWDQKKRHLTTAPMYKASTRAKLGFFYTVNYLFWALFIVLLLFKNALFIALGVFLLKITLQIVIFSGAMKRLNEKDLLPWFMLFEVLFLFIYPALLISKKFTKPNKWKN
jgi:glycosyltransferase involved in cell wall biosynthesis